MDFKIKFRINENMFVRDPENSALGKLMVVNAIDLICQLGFEQFNFKKLAKEINSTEASIYRYFNSKHQLLFYIVNCYWCYMEFLLALKTENVSDKKERLKIIIKILADQSPGDDSHLDYNKDNFKKIIISESRKVRFVKNITEVDNYHVFAPYKNFCDRIADVITAYNAEYRFPKVLSSTLVEASHQQQFFRFNLKELTDDYPENESNSAHEFLEDLVFKVLNIHQST